MAYRAVINLDFTGTNPNDYQKLISALLDAGWVYTETSALVIDTPTIERIWAAAEIVAKGAAAAGTLSALTLQVQLVADPRNYAARRNHPNALQDILGLPFPRIPPGAP
jgi:hypothetical protein